LIGSIFVLLKSHNDNAPSSEHVTIDVVNVGKNTKSHTIDHSQLSSVETYYINWTEGDEIILHDECACRLQVGVPLARISHRLNTPSTEPVATVYGRTGCGHNAVNDAAFGLYACAPMTYIINKPMNIWSVMVWKALTQDIHLMV
jgi:hypothetical protein